MAGTGHGLDTFVEPFFGLAAAERAGSPGPLAVFHHPHGQAAAIQFVGSGLAGGTGPDYQCVILLGHATLVIYGFKQDFSDGASGRSDEP